MLDNLVLLVQLVAPVLEEMLETQVPLGMLEHQEVKETKVPLASQVMLEPPVHLDQKALLD